MGSKDATMLFARGSKESLASPTSQDTAGFRTVDKTLTSPRAERIGFKAGKPFNSKANHFNNRRKTADGDTPPVMYSGADHLVSPGSDE